MLEHLTREQISVLLDDPEGVSGAVEHLADCVDCAREYELMSRMRMALSALPDLEPPANEWERVQQALGLHPMREGVFSPVWRKASSWPLQAAAVVALFAAGLLVGQRMGTEGAGDVAQVTNGAATTGLATPAENEFTEEPEKAYLRTVADLQALRDTDFESADWRERPEAVAERITHLDAMIEASREALEEAPADPVLNNFLFQMVDERDVLAGELNQALRMTAAEY